MEPPVLEIRLFGPLSVTLREEPLPRLRSRTAYWLLALLALRLGREVSREWLAATLWPDSDATLAFYNLRRCLTNLRQALGNDSDLLLSPTPQTLCLAPEGVWVDVAAFDTAMQCDAPDSLEQAIALHRGMLLEGCPEEWVLVERTIRAQHYFTALETLAAYEIAQRRPANAVRLLRVLVAGDPAREESQCALMQALADMGDFAAITQVYRELCLRLDHEFHSPPSPETERLYRRLQQQAKQPGTRPEASAVSAQPPRQLPVPLTRLIGREEEIEEILKRLNSSRLVTLTGAGGIGKTRLAIEVTERAASHTPDGAFFVDLAPLAQGSLLPQAVAQALQLKETPGQSVGNLLRAHLQARHLLLVLDNCEHLLAAGAALVADLLQRCPQVRILATSRQALGITGEVSYRVPSLTAPPAHVKATGEKDRWSALLDYGSVRLFVERARAAESGFAVTRHNVEAIGEICRRLDGIPLALEMAAARVKTLSAVQIAERLEACFALLTGGSRTALPRQQTLRATLDWSWNLLAPTEQILLSRLSVFAGGWTLDAAEQVGSGPASTVGSIREWEVLDLLTSLADQSLVVAQMQEEATRYRLLETVRQYAGDRLEERQETPTIRARHRDYFLSLAEKARPNLTGPEQARWLEVLETEHDNLRQAMAFCLEATEGEAPGWHLGAALQTFWMTRGHLNEGRERLTALLSHPLAQTHTPARTYALIGAGEFAVYQGDYASARSLFAESLAIGRELGNKADIALSLKYLGETAGYQGDFAAARSLYEETLAIQRELGSQADIALALSALGNVATFQCEYASARALYEETLALWQELGNKRGLSSAFYFLGRVAHHQGNYASARALYERSLGIMRESGESLDIAYSLSALGNVAASQGEFASARSLYEESLTIRRELGNKAGIALSLTDLGDLAFSESDYTAASSLYEESLLLWRELGDKRGIAAAYRNLGNVACAQGDYAATRTLYEASLTLWQELGDKRIIAYSLEAAASLAGKEGREEHAAHLWGAASALREAIQSPLPPNEIQKYEREVAAIQEALGEAAFAAAWTFGHALTWEQAVACALERC